MTRKKGARQSVSRRWGDGITTNPGDTEFDPHRHLKDFTEEQQVYLKTIEAGKTLREACENAGVSRYISKTWEKKSKFKAALDFAKGARIEEMEDAAFECARQGHWPALQKILESHIPDTYGPKAKIEHTGKDGKDLIPELDNLERAKRLAFFLDLGAREAEKQKK